MPDNVTDDAPDSTDDPGSARHTWIASLISTVVTLPLAFFALVYSMLSPMACDSCSEADAHRFDASFGPAWTVSCCGLLLSLVILVASWVCTRRRPCGRDRPRRCRTRHRVLHLGRLHDPDQLALISWL